MVFNKTHEFREKKVVNPKFVKTPTLVNAHKILYARNTSKLILVLEQEILNKPDDFLLELKYIFNRYLFVMNTGIPLKHSNKLNRKH